MLFYKAVNLRINSFIACLISLSMCLTLQGCTLAMWKNNFIGHVKEPKIIGNFSDKSGEKLLVGYVTRKSEIASFKTNYYFSIPFNDGITSSIFQYSGTQKTVNGILNDIPPERLIAIRDYTFDKGSYINSKFHKYTPANVSGGTYGASQLYFESQNVIPLNEMGITLIPYVWHDKPMSSGFNTRKLINKDGVFDSDVKFLILPNKQKRYKTERINNTFQVTLATPPMLAFDALLIALNIILYPL